MTRLLRDWDSPPGRPTPQKTMAAIAVFAVIASGCGTDQAPPSQSEFARQADAICTKAQERRAAGEARQAADEMMSDLHDLQPPERIEEAFTAWIDALDKSVLAVIALRDAPTPADRRAANERLSAAAERVYETQDALPLPQSCISS